MEIKKVPKCSKKFWCSFCDYGTDKKSQYDRHVLSDKHKWKSNGNKKCSKTTCENCGKIYKTVSGLWKHKKICIITPQKKDKIETETNDNSMTLVKIETEPVIDSKLIMKVLEENKELRTMLCQQQEKHMHNLKEQQEQHHREISKLIPKIGNTTNHNNQKFNLQVFIHEQCKDAINWDEFIKSIQLGVSDLDKIMDSNITTGITQVLCKSIDELGVYKRPVHCLDSKRKKLCIKNEDEWQQDPTKNKELLESSNRKLQQHHIKLIQEWQKENPDWKENENQKDIYVKMIQTVMGDVDEDKCLAELSKHAYIPKNELIES